MMSPVLRKVGIFFYLITLQAKLIRRVDPPPAKLEVELGGPGTIQVQYGHADKIEKSTDVVIEHSKSGRFRQEFVHRKKLQAWIRPKDDRPADTSAEGRKAEAGVISNNRDAFGEVTAIGDKRKMARLNGDFSQMLRAKTTTRDPARAKAMIRRKVNSPNSGTLYAAATNSRMVSSSSGGSWSSILSTTSGSTISSGRTSDMNLLSETARSQSSSPKTRSRSRSPPPVRKSRSAKAA